MNIKDFIEKLKEYPEDTEVEMLGPEYIKCDLEYDYSGKIDFDYDNSMRGWTLYLRGDFD